jgi:hypothetical protein
VDLAADDVDDMNVGDDERFVRSVGRRGGTESSGENEEGNRSASRQAASPTEACARILVQPCLDVIAST